MARWIVRLPSKAESPEGGLDALERDPAVHLVDRVGARLAMIDATTEEVARLRRRLPGWRIEREQQVHLPDTWPRVQRS